MCVCVAQVRVSTLVVKSATEESARFKATRPRSNTSVTSCVVTTQILSAAARLSHLRVGAVFANCSRSLLVGAALPPIILGFTNL